MRDLFTPASRAEQIFTRFCEFHADNPHIWELFERFALQLAAAGRVRYSVAAIIDRIRWHVDVDTSGPEVKINNDFKAYYARMFMSKHPEHGEFFQLRRRTSADRDPFDIDLPVVDTGPVGNEDSLLNQLRGM